MAMLILLFLIVPLFAALLLQLLSNLRRDISDWLANLAMISLLALSAASLYFAHASGALLCNIGGWAPGIGIDLLLDPLSGLFLLIISFVGTMAAIYSVEYMKAFTDKPRYFTLFLILIAGMNGVVLTGDLFNLFIFMEIASLASYALVAFGCGAEELEASFRYMVLGTIASSFILLGIVVLYSMTGTLNMAQVSVALHALGGNAALKLCFALFLLGFSLKAALVPFHAWLPDAHQSAPAPISAMLSGVLIKTAGIYCICRITFNVFGMDPVFSNILLILGAISMIAGALLAIGQWDYKRMLAYSSISQMGYIVLALGINTPLAILGGLFHLFNHAVFKPLLFLNAGSVEHSTGSHNMKDMGGLKDKLPATAATSFIASLSISGIPPLNGFWSKLIIIVAAVSAGKVWYAAIAVIISIITLAYFLKIQRYVYLGEARRDLLQVREASAAMIAPMLILSLACIAIGLSFPIVLHYLIDPAVKVLVNGLGYARMVLGG